MYGYEHNQNYVFSLFYSDAILQMTFYIYFLLASLRHLRTHQAVPLRELPLRDSRKKNINGALQSHANVPTQTQKDATGERTVLEVSSFLMVKRILQLFASSHE